MGKIKAWDSDFHVESNFTNVSYPLAPETYPDGEMSCWSFRLNKKDFYANDRYHLIQGNAYRVHHNGTSDEYGDGHE